MIFDKNSPTRQKLEYDYESFLDLPTRLTDWPQGWIGKASNDISEPTSPRARHQWPKTWLAFKVQVETPTRRILISKNNSIELSFGGDKNSWKTERYQDQTRYFRNIFRNLQMLRRFREEGLDLEWFILRASHATQRQHWRDARPKDYKYKNVKMNAQDNCSHRPLRGVELFASWRD